MAQISYLDFDLMIEHAGEKNYRVRVLSSPAGQATGKITLPFSDLELENFVLKLSRTRRGVRRLESPEMEAAKAFGGKLYKAVFDDELMGALRSSLDEARKQRRGLRIRLRLNDAPDLVNLPWEYLYNPSLNRFLSLSVRTPLIRYLDLPERITPLALTLPLRVLAVISSPSDYPDLDVEREWNNLKAALADLEQRGVLVLDRLETASPTQLQYSLRRNEYHIFHFIGHGGFNEQAQDGILLFEEESGRGRPLSGQYLGTLLHDENTLRLAVLNACEGGRTGTSDPFAGVAQSLVQQGLPAVIGMQFEVTDAAAITFAREFYTAIADGYPVDASLAEARKAIFSLGNDIEWGTPVLYMRAPDGMIFDLSKLPETSQAPAASVSSDTLSEPSPARHAKPEPDIEAIYEDALSAYWEDDWTNAWELFRQVVRIDPGYRDAADRLEQARTQVLLAKLYEQAGSLHQEHQWSKVINKFGEIHALDPNYPDPDGLLTGARNQLADAERKQKVQDLYRRAMEARHAQRWQEAYDLFAQVNSLEPDYSQTRRMLENVSAELKASASSRAQEQLGHTTRTPARPTGAVPGLAGAASTAPASRKALPRLALFAFGGVALLGIGVIIYLIIRGLTGDSTGPLIAEVKWGPKEVFASGTINLFAIIDDRSNGNSPIASAEYSLDGGNTWSALLVQDGAFDQASELVFADLQAPDIADTYSICVRGVDQKGNPGAESCSNLNVLPPPPEEGPKVLDDITADPNPVAAGAQVTFTATIDNSDPGGSSIALAEYSLDGGDTWSEMRAQDGVFDQEIEAVTMSIQAPDPPKGPSSTQILCVRGIDSDSNQGQPTCIQLMVEARPPTDTRTPTPTPTQTATSTPTATLTPTPTASVVPTTTVNKVIYGHTDGDTDPRPLGFFIWTADGRWYERILQSNDSFPFQEIRRDQESIHLQSEELDVAIQLDLKNRAVFLGLIGASSLAHQYDILSAETLSLPSDPVNFVEQYWHNVGEGNYARAWTRLSHNFREEVSSHKNDFSSYVVGFADKYCHIYTSDASLLNEWEDGDGRKAVVAGTLTYDTCGGESHYIFEITLIFDSFLQDWLYVRGDYEKK